MIAFLFNNNIKDEKIKKEYKMSTQSAFAIMVQNEDKTGYIESTSNTFPSDMTLNLELTNCTDENGTKVENALTYEEGNVIVETNKKIYCYLYFDANSGFGNQLLQNPTSGLNTTLEDGLYRYQGTSINNYICFGTSDKDTCLSNTDAHMYRIIGITEDGKLKVIKKEALNSTMQWYSNFTTNITWPDSTIYKNINGSSFYTNTIYVPSGWENKIEDTTWKYGDNTNVNVTADALYNIENAWTSTVSAKIGLMYAHDYYYAYQSGGLNCSSSGSYSTCVKSWMFISVNDSGAPSLGEWTLSRYGFNSSSTHYTAYGVGTNGYVSYYDLNSTRSVRPVFFLKSDIELIGGTGTSTDPFIIS